MKDKRIETNTHRDEIEAVIEEITERNGTATRKRSPHRRAIRPVGIRNILIHSTEYDYFVLEEEGRLSSLLGRTYGQLEKGYIPRITRVEDLGSIMSSIDDDDVDLLVIFNMPDPDKVLDLAKSVKHNRPDLPVIYVGRDNPELERATEQNSERSLDWIFTWSGDGEVFLHITQFLEEWMNRDGSLYDHEPRKILIMDGSPRFYTHLLSQAFEAIREHMECITREDLSSQQRLNRIRHRPRVMIARTPEEASACHEMYRDVLICGLIDIRRSPENANGCFPPPWNVKENTIPIMALSSSSDDEGLAGEMGAMFVREGSPNYNRRIRGFLEEMMGPVELVFRDSEGDELQRASDMRTLESSLWALPGEILSTYSRNGDIGRWLVSRSEFQLEDAFSEIIASGSDPEGLRKGLIDAVERYKISLQKGTITRYSRKTYGPHVKFSRIGKGAMGGKAKGLAFMDKILSTYFYPEILPDMDISMPRTIVLCSDIFDAFIEENSLRDEDLYTMSDERIAVRFMESDLPAILLGDVRAFVRETKVPIVVRSSSLLEDALLHPFAGVYSSLLLSNVSWGTDMRFKELCNAIKYVFASVFFQKARTYLETTPSTSEDEKMAVIIQELVGRKHGDLFYPTVSGVAKSYDYYPSGSCRAKDGVANVALGLGKAVVEGDTSFRFCPIHPDRPKYGTIKELLRQSQTRFFAVDLNTYVNIVQRDEDSGLTRLGLEIAEGDGSLEHIASTYSPRNDRLSPGVGDEGPRVIDFAPILKTGTLPLARAVQMLLRVGEIALGKPVEIEFAMNIDPEGEPTAELYLLQVRGMISMNNEIEVDVGAYEDKEMLCRTDNVLGNMIVDDICHIVYVKPEAFDMSKSIRVADQIRKMNRSLMEQGRPYVLIGPGRWGSTDQWLGIPVAWSDIAGARIIIETPVEERIIDPSQGSHFFHNMISANTGYMTIGNDDTSDMDWEWLDAQPAAGESQNLKHIRLSRPLEVRLDGKRGRGVILKRNKPGREEDTFEGEG